FGAGLHRGQVLSPAVGVDRHELHALAGILLVELDEAVFIGHGYRANVAGEAHDDDFRVLEVPQAVLLAVCVGQGLELGRLGPNFQLSRVNRRAQSHQRQSQKRAAKHDRLLMRDTEIVLAKDTSSRAGAEFCGWILRFNTRRKRSGSAVRLPGGSCASSRRKEGAYRLDAADGRSYG